MSKLVNYSITSDSTDCKTPETVSLTASKWDTPSSSSVLRCSNFQTSTPLRNKRATAPTNFGFENRSHKQKKSIVHFDLSKKNKLVPCPRKTTNPSMSPDIIQKLRPRNSSISYSELRNFTTPELETLVKLSRKCRKSVKLIPRVMSRRNSSIRLEENDTNSIKKQRKSRKSIRHLSRNLSETSSSFESNAKQRFKCPEPGCKKSYSRLYSVGVHYNSFHLKIKLQCPYCKCDYAISYLSQHMSQKCNEYFKDRSLSWDLN